MVLASGSNLRHGSGPVMADRAECGLLRDLRESGLARNGLARVEAVSSLEEGCGLGAPNVRMLGARANAHAPPRPR